MACGRMKCSHKVDMKGHGKLHKLTRPQKQKLEAHSGHHGKKHMMRMRMHMMHGASFKEAHARAGK